VAGARALAAPIAGVAQRSRRSRRSASPLWFVGPFAAVYLAFFAYPLVQLFVLSFTHTQLGNPTGRFIGTANYARLLHDPGFWGALGHTLLFVVLTVVPLVLVGLLLAILVLRVGRLRGFAQAAFFLPYILPVSVVTLIWGWLLNPHFGIVNHMLGTAIAWFDDRVLALPAVAAVTVWWTVGFNMLLFMAGLQTVPKEATEAAELDGATALQVFRHVTWPLLWPTTSLVLMLQVIASLKIFSQVYLLTAGGPGTSTRVLLEFMYDTGFTNLDTGYASTIAVAIFIVIVGISAVEAKLLTMRRGR
jgi:multiple sugar transport system permease protein